MYVIKNYQAILRQTERINEAIDLAVKIQKTPPNSKSSEDLSFVLKEGHKRIMHLIKQLNKGIAMEEEIHKINSQDKNSPKATIYVAPWVCCFESSHQQYLSKDFIDPLDIAGRNTINN